MTILEKIKEHKIREVHERKQLYPVKLLEKSIYYSTPTVSLKEYVTAEHRSGIIAEFKRKSPTSGDINKYADAESVTIGFMQAGASALSILTDETFFGAMPDDIRNARKFNYCPILRKDFIIDEYQIVESKSLGADAFLLIAKILTSKQIKELSAFGKSLGLEVLLETNNEEEILENANAAYDLIAINNRDLSTFEVDKETSIRLGQLVPAGTPKIAASGINNPATINLLREHGFNGFLIGEYFMKNSQPAESCKEFIKQISS